MAIWFKQRDSKETRKYEACKEYVTYGQFYDWYSHPALSNLIKREKPLIICTKCTKRETGGKKLYKKLLEVKQV